MGQFSYCCAICDQEILHGHMPGYSKFTRAILFWPNGDRVSGEYDGYGRLGGIDLVDQGGDWKIVHQCCNRGQPYAEMTKGGDHAADQGWWPGERLAIVRYGQPDMSDIKKVQRYVCIECNATWKARWSGGICPNGCVRPANYHDDPEEIGKRWSDSREMVFPFTYLNYNYGDADGIVICSNEHYEMADWSTRRAKGGDPEAVELRNCFAYGSKSQARITKPDDWDISMLDVGDEPVPFEIRCSSCKTTKVKIVPLKEVIW